MLNRVDAVTNDEQSSQDAEQEPNYYTSENKIAFIHCMPPGLCEDKISKVRYLEN